jgi:hypothetical protein
MIRQFVIKLILGSPVLILDSTKLILGIQKLILGSLKLTLGSAKKGNLTITLKKFRSYTQK